MRVPRPARTTVVSFCVLLGTLILTSTPAQAARNHVLSASLGSPGEGAGELSLVPYSIGIEGSTISTNKPETPGSGVAVDDATGDVYVADTGNRRVDEFSAGGGFVRAWGWGVADGAAKLETCEVVCRAGVAGAGVGQFDRPVFVAVDNSGGPSEGDVYVGAGIGSVASIDQQELEFAGATGGSYTLSFEGETTPAIPYTAGAAMIGSALQALAKIGPGNVEVHGAEGGDVIQFVGALGDVVVPQLTVDYSGLAPAGAKATVRTAFEGAPYVPEVVDKFDAEGGLIEAWGDEGQLDGEGVAGGPFSGEFTGVAVDGSGDLWVFTGVQDGLFEFGEAGGLVESCNQSLMAALRMGLVWMGQDEFMLVVDSNRWWCCRRGVGFLVRSRRRGLRITGLCRRLVWLLIRRWGVVKCMWMWVGVWLSGLRRRVSRAWKVRGNLCVCRLNRLARPSCRELLVWRSIPQMKRCMPLTRGPTRWMCSCCIR